MSRNITVKTEKKACNNSDNESCETESIIDVKRIFISDYAIPVCRKALYRKTRSEDNIRLNINYDDLCGSSSYPESRSNYTKDSVYPALCIWEYITQTDIEYLREHHQNEEAIVSFLGAKFPDNTVCKQKNDVFLKVIWQFFELLRDKRSSEKSVSAALGLIYQVHRFLVSNPWCSAEEIYKFFYESVLLHSVEDPPRSSEIFTLEESELLLELFYKVYMENLTLLRLYAFEIMISL